MTRTLLNRIVLLTAVLLLVIGVFFSGWIIRRIKESEEKYRRLIENANDAIFVTDVKTGQIVDANPKAEELVGLPLPEILDRPHREIDEAFSCEESAGSLGSGVPPPAFSMKERRVRRSDGRFVPVDVTTSKLEVNGRQVIQSIYRDVTQRKRFEEELRRLNETLEQKVAERSAVAEKRAQQLEALAIELTHAEQRERRRVAQSIHDNLQQILIAARMRVERLLASPEEEAKKQPLVGELGNLLKSAIDASRSLTVELSPPVLYDAGLPAGIEWLSRRMKESYGLTVGLETVGQVEPIPNDLRAFLFQSVRELLLNVVKYAQVDRADVILSRHVEEDRELVTVTVRDEGVGFTPEERAAAVAETGGFGLFSICQRLELLGGRMSTRSKKGHGTRIDLCLPVSTSNGAEELVSAKA